MIRKPDTFTIRRSEWAREKQKGTGPAGLSMLLNEIGGKCCLGFFGLACGIEKEQIFNKFFIMEIHGLGTDRLIDFETESRLTYVNDRMFRRSEDWSNVTDAQQEALIAAGFATIGVQVKFED